jgi:hypothetical protein
MITKELINYVRLQKQQGESNAEIRAALLNNNWSEEDINEAFLSIDQQETLVRTSQESQGLKPVQTQPSNNIITSKPETKEKKPKVAKMVSIFFFLVSILYVWLAVSMTGMMVIMDKAGGGDNLVFSFLRYFPTFGPIPILFSLAALLFFYMSFKIRNASKFSFWAAIMSTVIVPFPLDFISQILLKPFTQSALLFSAKQSEDMPSVPIKSVNLWLNSPIFIFFLIAFVLLLFSFKKFQFDNEKLSKKARIFLTLISIILVIPIFSIVSMGYIKAQDRDYGYKKAQSAVGYHIYKSTLSEEELSNATKFITNKDLAGKHNAVQVAYDLPFDQLIKSDKTKLVILKQVQVKPPFDLNAFILREISNPITINEISLQNIKNQKAFLVKKKLVKKDIYFLSYVTPDDVLIFIASPELSPEKLIEFADSLR